MSDRQRQRVYEVFAEAIELTGDERTRYLNAACGDDDELRRRVERLLAHDERGSAEFLKRSPAWDCEEAERAPASSIFVPGAIIGGQYRIIRQIGQGGMGCVYEAEQLHPTRRVALKAILQPHASTQLLARFDREIRALARLHHPGIATIFESGVIEQPNGPAGPWRTPYYVMEMVDGMPLTEYAQRRSLALRDRLELIVQVADAVQHAHEHGVVHRDLKPGNVLVMNDGRAKVLDFGVARLLPRAGERGGPPTLTLQTDAGQLLGTLAYMSPEQVSGDPQRIDAQSDVYALGVMLYEILTGRLPFDVRGKSIAEAARIIRDEEPQSLTSFDPDSKLLRGDVETIALKAIDRDRRRRYQTAADLAADLRRHLRDEPIAARPPSAMYRLSKFARRNRGLVGGVVSAFVILIAGLIGTSWLAVRLSHQKAIALQREQQALHAQQAEARERDRAERRFNDLRHLATTFIFDVEDAIRDLHGSTAARELLVATGLRYLDALAAEAGDDPGLMREIAGGYRKLGSVQGEPSQSNLGDIPGALQSFRKSVSMLRDIIRARPGDAEAVLEFTNAQRHLASVLRAAGQSAEALALYDENHQALGEFAGVHGREPRIQDQLAIAAADLGRMQADQGQLHAALISYDQYIEYVRAKMDRDEATVQERLNFAVVRNASAKILSQLERHEEAEQQYRDAMVVLRPLVDESPDQKPLLSVWALLQSGLGGVLADMNRHQEAQTLLHENLIIRQRLADADPNDARALRALGTAHYALGNAFELEGNHARALPHWEAYIEVCERGIATSPRHIYLHHDLAIALGGAGKALMNVQRLEEAWSLLGRRREVCRAIMDDSPEPRYQREAAMAALDAARCAASMLEQPALPAMELRHIHEEAVRLLVEALTYFGELDEAGSLLVGDADYAQKIQTIRMRIDAAMEARAPLERGDSSGPALPE